MPKDLKVALAIETSCDDTSVALVDSNSKVISMLSADQNKDHLPFGGVVPEVASRGHTENLLPLIDQILKENSIKPSQLDCICVTNRPGLVGSLLVGLVTAKALALAWNKDFIGVNHLEGHLLAPWLSDSFYRPEKELEESLPSLVLAVSGGHTHLCLFKSLGEYEILGQSIDDAAGEALDKFAKELGLGFPGGAMLDKWAREGNPNAFHFPKGLQKKTLSFSFSGTKAAGVRQLEKMSEEDIELSIKDLAASYEKDVIDILFEKLEAALKTVNVKSVAITGGVSANSYLRERAKELGLKIKLPVLIPPLKYCTDNSAMIGYAGLLRYIKGEKSDQELSPSRHSYETDFRISCQPKMKKIKSHGKRRK